MMEWMRSWLTAVLAAGILCSLADALMPAGAVRRVGALVCGLVMICALLSPLTRLTGLSLQKELERGLEQLETDSQQLEAQVGEQLKTIIEQECAAYIVDKAKEKQLECTASVGCAMGEDGVYFPQWVRVTGKLDPAAQAWLVQCISENLGVPQQRQYFTQEEESA